MHHWPHPRLWRHLWISPNNIQCYVPSVYRPLGIEHGNNFEDVICSQFFGLERLRGPVKLSLKFKVKLLRYGCHLADFETVCQECNDMAIWHYNSKNCFIYDIKFLFENLVFFGVFEELTFFETDYGQIWPFICLDLVSPVYAYIFEVITLVVKPWLELKNWNEL